MSLPIDDSFLTHDDFYSDAYCDVCEKWYDKKETTDVEDQVMCDYCLNKHAATCDGCGDYHTLDKLTTFDDGLRCCTACLEDMG